MKPCKYPVGDLLPHAPPMILIDEVTEYGKAGLRATVTITPFTPFSEADGVQAYVGLEYMAQACSAHAGAMALEGGRPVRVGFLLGTRCYRAHVPQFRIGDRLTVSATMIYSDDEMGTFDCRIEAEGQCMAEARLNVFQPQPDHPLLRAASHD